MSWLPAGKEEPREPWRLRRWGDPPRAQAPAGDAGRRDPRAPCGGGVGVEKLRTEETNAHRVLDRVFRQQSARKRQAKRVSSKRTDTVGEPFFWFLTV